VIQVEDGQHLMLKEETQGMLVLLADGLIFLHSLHSRLLSRQTFPSMRQMDPMQAIPVEIQATLTMLMPQIVCKNNHDSCVLHMNQ